MIEYLKTLQRMDYLIRIHATGNPTDFAGRLDISERSLYNYLAVIRQLGAPLTYSRSKNSYMYACSGKLSLKFEFLDETNKAQ